jgi:NADPH:quinone reductase-like Zn-dependent oxidoreductase
MKAVIWTRYGPPEVLQLQEVPAPSPREREVLIQVQAATVTLGDCELRSLRGSLLLAGLFRIFLGPIRPRRVRILGQELSGVVAAVGSQVTKFKAGDEVFAPCLLRLGAYAEYQCLPESYPRLKPSGISFEAAATLPTGGINGLHFLTVANVRAGERVLLNGAGGSIGSYAIQIARNMGAQVTAVDSAEKLEMLRALGADRVIDYTREDFTRTGRQYDVIIDVVGRSSFTRSLRALAAGGRYVLGNPSLAARWQARWTPMSSGRRVIVALAPYKEEYYRYLTDEMQAGRLQALIDRRYPLEQTALAHRYVDGGHKKGSVVIQVGERARA